MKKYVIEAGEHHASGFNFGIHFGDDSLNQIVTFAATCLYVPFDKEHDTNKGFGFTYGLPKLVKPTPNVRYDKTWYNHLLIKYFNTTFTISDGLRWGWRQHPTNPHKLQVCLYAHDVGEVKISSYIDVLPNTPYELEMYMSGGEAWLEVRDDISIDTVSLKGLTFKPKWGYKNFPYFGGDNPARHTTHIYKTEL